MTEDQLLIYWAAVSCGKIDPEAEDEFTQSYVDSLMDWWNPLYNNEDAFRLAIKNKLNLYLGHGYCSAEYSDINWSTGIVEQFDPEGHLDDEELTRYAILIASAKIGENRK